MPSVKKKTRERQKKTHANDRGGGCLIKFEALVLITQGTQNLNSAPCFLDFAFILNYVEQNNSWLKYALFKTNSSYSLNGLQ